MPIRIFLYPQNKDIASVLFLIGIIFAITHYFKVSEQLSEKRIERIIDSVNIAGIPADHLKELSVPGRESSKAFNIILGKRTTNQEYTFEILDSFWDTDTLQLRLIN